MRCSILTIALLFFALPARGQDGQLQDIKVGSSRIGGPGLTESERKASAAADEDEVPLSEENLPPKGNPKRLPGLHKITARYVRAQMWKDACERFDQIVEESGEEGMASDPAAKGYAAKAFYQCAEIEFRNHKYDKTEVLLKKSEQYGPSDYRHAGIRRQMMRENYKEEVGKQNWDKAIKLFQKYNATGADEDERIWLGEQLAKRAWEAYKTSDDVELKRAMEDAESVAPMNAEYRRLKDKLIDEKAGLGRAVMLTVGVALVVLALTQLSRWRSRAKVAAMEAGEGGGGSLFGKKNKFLDDD